MPTFFVYEYCCAIGAGGSLGREGRAMRDAVADDFRRLAADVLTLDAAGDAEAEQFRAMAARCDNTLVIVPESDGLLAARVGWAGGRAINSTTAAIRLTADKLATFDLWRAAGVPTPHSYPAHRFMPADLPLVFKPRDGAGSEGVRLVERWEDFRDSARGQVGRLMCQQFVPGRAASVAFLIGPSQSVPLLPTFQHLSDDGRFSYLGGELPIPPALAARAVALGRRAIDCVPGLRGYVGVDLVLGEAADGSQDFAIEINPRLTTSYVGLRALANTNLAGAMLDVCAGRPVEVRWMPERVSFTPDGAVTPD